jgi:hypothetical protein
MNLNTKTINLSIITLIVLLFVNIGQAVDWNLGNVSYFNKVNSPNIGGVIYADQYATIQDAINASCNCNPMDSSFGDTASHPVFIPPGNYTVSLVVPAYSEIYGVKGQTILKMKNNISAIKNENWDTSAPGQGYDMDIQIHDLNVDGMRNGGESKGGISLKSAPGAKITNVNTYNISGWAGIYLTGYHGVEILDEQRLIVSESHVYNITKGGGSSGVGIYFSAPQNVSGNIEKNNINNIEGQGIFVEDHADRTIVTRNSLYDIGGTALNMDVSNETKILYNFVSNSARCISGTLHYAIIDGNTCQNSVNDDMIINGRDAQIRNNILLVGVNTAGIRVVGSFNVSITGNYIANKVTPITIESGSLHNSIHDNYGVSPFNWGNFAAAPKAFGAGDTYYDTDVNYICFYNGADWKDVSTGLVTCS